MLNAQVTVTDALGNTNSTSTGITPGSSQHYACDTTLGLPVGVYPPITNFKLEVQDTVSGSHTTYSSYTGFIG